MIRLFYIEQKIDVILKIIVLFCKIHLVFMRAYVILEEKNGSGDRVKKIRVTIREE